MREDEDTEGRSGVVQGFYQNAYGYFLVLVQFPDKKTKYLPLNGIALPIPSVEIEGNVVKVGDTLFSKEEEKEFVVRRLWRYEGEGFVAALQEGITGKTETYNINADFYLKVPFSPQTESLPRLAPGARVGSSKILAIYKSMDGKDDYSYVLREPETKTPLSSAGDVADELKESPAEEEK